MSSPTPSRRRLLAAVAGAGGLAGCLGNLPVGGDGGGADATEETTAPDAEDDERQTVEAPTLAEQGRPASICEASVLPDSIQGIGAPAFAADWSAVEEETDAVPGPGHLRDDDAVVGITADGRARAYPIAAFWKFEVVNDEFGDPLLLTFCPLCNSGMVADRVVDGETLTFDVSGQLWVPPEIYTRAAEADGKLFAADRREVLEDGSVKNSGNLVFYDLATESFWSQLLATAICGPYEGTELTIRPSTLTTWADWKGAHPDTDVLLPPPHSELV